MRLVEFIPFRLTEMADIFSIKIDGKETTESQEFFITFKNTEQFNLQSDFEQVIKSLAGIGEHGAKESFSVQKAK